MKYDLPYNDGAQVIYEQNETGEVKYCPQCKKIQQITCCACGCGNCIVCDYRWSCNLREEVLYDPL